MTYEEQYLTDLNRRMDEKNASIEKLGIRMRELASDLHLKLAVATAVMGEANWWLTWYDNRINLDIAEDRVRSKVNAIAEIEKEIAERKVKP